MATSLHKDLPLSERHAAISYEYADATARGAATGFVTADLGKLAWQQDDDTTYILTATTPTWVAVGGGGGGTLDSSYDFGGAGLGRSVEVNAGAVVLANTGTADNNNILEVSKTQSGGDRSGALIYMTNNVFHTGNFVDAVLDSNSPNTVLNITHGGTGSSSANQALTWTDPGSQSQPVIDVNMGASASAGGVGVRVDKLSLGAASADAGIAALVENSTAAAAGAQQYSPIIALEGQGWKTDATAATREVQMGLQVQPVQGAANPTGALHFLSNINNVGWASVASLSSAGVLSASGLTMGGNTVADVLVASDGASTGDDEVATAGWVSANFGSGGGVTALSVTDIDDPSTELNAIAGSAKGDLRLCYETVAGRDEWTMYAWDDADSGIEKVPIRVDGSTGMWNAIAGKYVNAIKLPDDGALGASANRASLGFASDSTGIGGLTRNYANGDIYLEGVAGDNLIFGCGNVNVVQVDSSFVFGGLRSGSVSAAYYYLSSDSDTGIYRPAANEYAITTFGTQAGRWDAYQVYTAASHVNPDTDSANDLGQTGTRWRNLYVDDVIATAGVQIGGALDHDGTTAGFYGTTPITQQTGVAVTAAGIHAALVALGLITA